MVDRNYPNVVLPRLARRRGWYLASSHAVCLSLSVCVYVCVSVCVC